MAGTSAPPSSSERQWFIASRWQEYEGEGRANLIRILAVAAFYVVELINYYGLNLGFVEFPQQTERSLHLAITMLTFAWTMVCLGVLLCRTNYVFPASLKYISTGCDLVLLTAILALADGPKSGLVIAYFLVVALACLRFHLPLIWFVTAGAIGGYLVLVGHAYWYAEKNRIERYKQLLFLLALAFTGIILGQVIRRVRHLALRYAEQSRPGGGT